MSYNKGKKAVTVSLPLPLHKWLMGERERSLRSLSAEIVHLLQQIQVRTKS